MQKYQLDLIEAKETSYLKRQLQNKFGKEFEMVRENYNRLVSEAFRTREQLDEIIASAKAKKMPHKYARGYSATLNQLTDWSRYAVIMDTVISREISSKKVHIFDGKEQRQIQPSKYAYNLGCRCFYCKAAHKEHVAFYRKYGRKVHETRLSVEDGIREVY